MAVEPLKGKVLEWAEAEALFLERRGYSPASYYALRDWSREMGFTISYASSYAVIARAQQELARIIVNGGNLAEFEAWAVGAGQMWSRSYTQLVFRMAVFGAYNQARYTQMNDPAVRKTFEILVYDAVADEHTRIEHAQMNGRSWKREHFPAEWWPPNGFNCRCEVRSVTKLMEQEGGWQRQSAGSTPGGVRPDVGFGRTPNDKQSLLRRFNATLRRNRRQAGG